MLSVFILIWSVTKNGSVAPPSRPTTRVEPPKNTPQPSPRSPPARISISNAVLAKSIGPDERPVEPSQTFQGPTASVVVHFWYDNARPNQDKIGAVLRGAGNDISCEEVFAVRVSGPWYCEWIDQVDLGQHTMSITINGQSVLELPFNVVRPPPTPRPKVDVPTETTKRSSVPGSRLPPVQRSPDAWSRNSN